QALRQRRRQGHPQGDVRGQGSRASGLLEQRGNALRPRGREEGRQADSSSQVSDTEGSDQPIKIEVPTEGTQVAVRPGRDFWDKLAILVQPLGGLFTALALAILGFKSSEWLNRRQAIETNTRLYSELMSKREESESALRKDMFQTIIGTFVSSSGKGDLDSSGLNLALLASNFPETLN